MKTLLLSTIAVLAAGSEARAELADGDRADRSYFAGTSVRTDLGTHVTRISGGMRFGGLSLSVVLDPEGYTSGTQTDTDVMAELDLGARGSWAAMVGWRTGSVPVLGTTYWHEKPFVGLSAPLPSLFWGHVRTRFGGEFALTVVKHGEQLPTRGFWDEPGMGWISCNWGLFLRLEAARGF